MLKHLHAIWHIGNVLAKHDALFILDYTTLKRTKFLFGAPSKNASKNKGEALSNALHELGAAYIKLGQMLSTRPDLVGEELAHGLTKLQDQVPAFPTEQAKKIIETSLGGTLEKFFSQFDLSPIAAASVAQVHFAITNQGEEVAVKILRPQIAEQLQKDLLLFRWLAKKVEKHLPKSKRLKPISVVETLEKSLLMELDLRFEAAASEELAENLQAETSVTIPKIDWQRTSKQVLTMQRIHGTPISDLASLKAQGHNLSKLAESLAEIFFIQALRDGFFHADFHPGNIFVQQGGKIALVDFGIMGRLDFNTRLNFAIIIKGFIEHDYLSAARAHLHAGYIPTDTNLHLFAQSLRAIGQPIFNRPLNEISLGELLAQMFAITASFNMELQPQLLLLQKTLIMVEGIGRSLSPEINIWQLAEKPIQTWAKDNLTPMAYVKRAVEDFVYGVVFK